MESFIATSCTFDFSEVIKNVRSDISSDVKKFLENLDNDFCEQHEIQKSENFLEWAGRLNYLKQVKQPVPDFILPKHCSGELIDVKVFAKRGPDDEIYDKHKAVRDRVARGNTFLNITHGKGKGVRCILYGLKKFTGGLGDDDDRDRGDNHTWKRYFTKTLNEASCVIATRKANGEAAHLSCVKIDGHLIMCAGSKNVHLLFRNRDDISHYHGDRYRIASEICHTVMEALEGMEEDKKQLLLNFLAATRMTGIFEILSPDHQHVEDLSYLEKPSMQFITWTFTELEPKPDEQLCTVPPHIGIEIARALGLTTIVYEKIPVADVENRMKAVRQGYNYEGEVFYFLDGQGQVMGLLKKKTVWYIVCRALREKARNGIRALIKDKGTFTVSQCITKIEKRIDAIQKWLGLSNEATQQWKKLGISFMKWLVNEVERGHRDLDAIADNFPVTWKAHLKDNGLSDQIEVSCTEPDEGDDGMSHTESDYDGASIASGYSEL